SKACTPRSENGTESRSPSPRSSWRSRPDASLNLKRQLMPAKPTVQQFILLPSRGLTARDAPSTPEMTNFLLSLSGAVGAAKHTTPGLPSRTARGGRERGVRLRVLDSIHEDGAKLVELSPEAVSDLRVEQPGLQIVPVVYYRPALNPRPIVAGAPRVA